MDVWLVMFVLIHSIREMHQQGRNEFFGLIVIVVMKTVMIIIVNRLYLPNKLSPTQSQNNGCLVDLFEGSNGNINQLIRW